MMRWDELCDLYQAPKSARTATFHVSELMPASRVALASKWLANPTSSLLLMGDTGRGKTYFMWALMRRLVQFCGPETCRFIKSKALDDKILRDLSQYGTAEFFLSTLKEIPILFLDDFGVERATERTERDYLELIDARVDQELPTVVSTNLQDDEILKHFGSRIHSRMKTFVGVQFNGPDIRERM